MAHENIVPIASIIKDLRYNLLFKLELENNSLCDKGAIILFNSLKFNKSVEILNVSRNKITNVSM
jgi:hypothetical protein